MGANLICLTSNGGIPLFSRKLGNVEPLPFSMIGSLNGIHMFLKSHGAEIESTETENTTVVWKEFDGSIVIVAVAKLHDKKILNELLETVYNAMLFTVGSEELKAIKNVDRFKRELKASYPVIDGVLECLDFGDRNLCNSNNILKHVECILCSENETLQNCLDNFVECIGTNFGCLSIENCIAVATNEWWDLNSTERKILFLISKANSNCTVFDIPVFLPTKSPAVPYRFISVQLLESVRVSCLCGLKPDIAIVQQLSFQSWSPMLSTLRAASLIYPRNIPASFQFHSSIQGMLLLNKTFSKFILCTNTNDKDNKSAGEALKTFYYQSAKDLIENSELLETYWCAEYHKLHALKDGDNLICLMYHSSIPTHSMRLITKNTFTSVLSLEDIAWQIF